MAQLEWKKIKFSSDEEYYETLGFLSKEEDRPIDLFIEDNRPAGAWGVERRMRISDKIDLDFIIEDAVDEIQKGVLNVLESYTDGRVQYGDNII